MGQESGRPSGDVGDWATEAEPEAPDVEALNKQSIYINFYNAWNNINYCKFPNKGARREGKTLGGAIIRESTFPPSSGILQNENWTGFGWDMAKNLQKPSRPGVKKWGAPL